MGSPTVFSLAVAGFSGNANLISKSLTLRLFTFEELIWPKIFTSPVTLTLPVTFTSLLNVASVYTIIGVLVKELIVFTKIFDVAKCPEPTSIAIPFGLFVTVSVVIT